MALAQTLKAHLERHGVAWRTLRHPATASSHDTAAAAHVPEDHIAKAVVVRDERGPAMVVIPASHWLRLETLNAKLDRGFGLHPALGGPPRRWQGGQIHQRPCRRRRWLRIPFGGEGGDAEQGGAADEGLGRGMRMRSGMRRPSRTSSPSPVRSTRSRTLSTPRSAE